LHQCPRDFTRFKKVITEAHLQKLNEDGFTIIDNFLGEGWAHAILAEMKWLHKYKYMVYRLQDYNNKTQPETKSNKIFRKWNIIHCFKTLYI